VAAQPCCSQRATVAKLRAIKLPTGKLRAPRNQQYTTEVSQPGDAESIVTERRPQRLKNTVLETVD
jgi:hypothetical protein